MKVLCETCERKVTLHIKRLCSSSSSLAYDFECNGTGLKTVGNVLTGINLSTPKEPEPEPVEEEEKSKPKPKKVPKTENKFKTVFNKIKPLVLERDNHTCTKCGSRRYVAVHHIVHRKEGGTNDMSNLTTLCEECHAEEHKGEPVYNLMMKRIKDRKGEGKDGKERV